MLHFTLASLHGWTTLGLGAVCWRYACASSKYTRRREAQGTITIGPDGTYFSPTATKDRRTCACPDALNCEVSTP